MRDAVDSDCVDSLTASGADNEKGEKSAADSADERGKPPADIVASGGESRSSSSSLRWVPAIHRLNDTVCPWDALALSSLFFACELRVGICLVVKVYVSLSRLFWLHISRMWVFCDVGVHIIVMSVWASHCAYVCVL